MIAELGELAGSWEAVGLLATVVGTFVCLLLSSLVGELVGTELVGWSAGGGGGGVGRVQ